MSKYPNFSPRFPWWGPDLQTLRNTLAPPRVASRTPALRLELPPGDGSGDVMLAALHAEGSAALPLVVLLHGLGGSEESVYMQRSAAFFAAAGHRVLRLNLRGAGPSRPRCRQQYHAGRSEDFAAALRALPDALLREGIFAIGFSLGGNLLLKFLGEGAHGLPLRAAAAVSAPIDLAASCRRLLAPRNAPYHRYMLGRLEREALASPQLRADERAAILSARSLLDFDDRFVAPRNGFADAADYYARCSASGFLAAIRVPTLVIHALDDPWIPGEQYLAADWASNPCLEPLLSARGGHLGFHARDAESAWHDRCAALFFERV